MISLRASFPVVALVVASLAPACSAPMQTPMVMTAANALTTDLTDIHDSGLRCCRSLRHSHLRSCNLNTQYCDCAESEVRQLNVVRPRDEGRAPRGHQGRHVAGQFRAGGNPELVRGGSGR